jgi:hypothetical protein
LLISQSQDRVKIKEKGENQMSKLEKYIHQNVLAPAEETKRISAHIDAPCLEFKSDKDFGDKNFRIGWVPVSKPFIMEAEPHKHDNDQFLMFVGGDPKNMLDLGGEVELTLSEDGKNFEKFVFTKATWVFVPRGMYHCPLNFKKINDPARPIIFNDFFFGDYKRV